MMSQRMRIENRPNESNREGGGSGIALWWMMTQARGKCFDDKSSPHGRSYLSYPIKALSRNCEEYRIPSKCGSGKLCGRYDPASPCSILSAAIHDSLRRVRTAETPRATAAHTKNTEIVTDIGRLISLLGKTSKRIHHRIHDPNGRKRPTSVDNADCGPKPLSF